MLFSQPAVAAFLSGSFECAWQSVRPVPRVTIDFGNGRMLERTLRGNVATYLCTSEGETFDLVTGVVDAPEYVARLRQGLELFARLRERGDDARERVAGWHLRLAGGPPRGAAPAVLAYSKGIVEAPLLQQLVPAPETPSDGAGLTPFVSKFQVEAPLENAVATARVPFDASGLARDTLYAREHGHRLAHRFLVERALRPPAELTSAVYRELLHVELDDPYLGLAPAVLGGEGGRR